MIRKLMAVSCMVGICLFVISSAAILSAQDAADQLIDGAKKMTPAAVIDVWPGTAPGEKGDIGEEGFQDPNPNDVKVIQRMKNVTKPTLTVFKPPKEIDNGAAVVICPGGGYSILAWDLEGLEVAHWLNSIGVTGILLKYRVPRRADRPMYEAPLQDAQRALRLSRANAEAWGIDPDRIGILGFSAGGHLSATTSTNFDRNSYEAIDDSDKLSCRPDFTVLVYPAYLIDDNTKEFTEAIRPSEDTPPTFFAHAYDDRISPENSIRLFMKLRELKVPAELHVFSTGGHGFGLRPTENPCSHWPQRCTEWMKRQGLLEKK